jgi:guanylate kinase
MDTVRSSKRSRGDLHFHYPPQYGGAGAPPAFRGTDSDAVIEVRLKTAERELNEMENYDYIGENDYVRNAVFQVLLIMASNERNEKGE